MIGKAQQKKREISSIGRASVYTRKVKCSNHLFFFSLLRIILYKGILYKGKHIKSIWFNSKHRSI
jgi:hypothetical protein